jgi:hypothetical protein
VDPAKQVELPLIERIPSLHHPTVRGTAYSIELDTAVYGSPDRRTNRTVGSA